MLGILFRTELFFAEQYLTSYIVNHPEITAAHDLSSLTGFIIGGSRTSSTFRQRLISNWKDSIVSENGY